MEIIVENRRDPNEFYKFFDVHSIEKTTTHDGTEWIKAFRIEWHTPNGFEYKYFPEWKYKFYLV